MKVLTKSLIVAGIMGATGLGGLVTANVANAETSSSSTSSSPMSNLVDKLATTFNLDKTKVQAVFDEDRAAREAEREKEVSERIQALVDNKTITAAQKTAIESKIAEMKKEREANKDAMKDLSDEERKAKMDEMRKSLEDWAKTQNLDLSKLGGILGGPGGRGGHRDM